MTILLVSFLLLWGQAPGSQEAAHPPQKPVPDEYLVGPQDVISLTIFNDESLSRPALVVDTDGTIDCPYVGRQKVSGMTTRQIEEMLRRLLGVRTDERGVAHGYLNNPNINVTVKEYRSQRVYVTGAVRTPGEIELKGDPTLTRALAEAGYPTPESGSYVVITHTADTPPAPGSAPPAVNPEDQIRVPRDDIANGRASRIRLRAGDFIMVPPADKFFIYGEVKSPGQWVLSGDISVIQALALAGGLTDRANKNKITIQRTVNGRKVDVNVKESTPVLAGDTIVVHRRIF
jgi:polysaccharide export outer membrane protein